MPHAAAIMRLGSETYDVVTTNARFDRYHTIKLQDPNFDLAAFRRHWFTKLHALIDGTRDTLHCPIGFDGPLGTCVYDGSFTRLDGVDSPEPLILFTAVDRSDEHRTQAALRRELMTDALTTLPNRAGFLDGVECQEARGETDACRAVLVVDLIRFNRVNESLGPLAGDELIITVARRIKGALRAGDLLGRIGGNEFAIYSGHVADAEEALQIGKRVRDVLRTPIRISSYLINVEAAVGCALQRSDEDDTEEMLRRALSAVKYSKQTGGVEIYQPSSLAEAQERFALENRLREAINQDALTLHYQPIVDLASGQVIGFETLARWTDDVLGAVPPNKFIPVAEESGLIIALGRWALRTAARQLARWDAQYGAEMPLTLNVNVSAVQVARDDVAQAVRSALDEAGIDGMRIAVELTESAVLADVEKTKKLLEALKALGVAIAMDDFGTGYSNLASLQRLPIDILKIDRSFVSDLVGDEDRLAIVRAILSLAGALGMSTVAEGVETRESNDALAMLGCAKGQGYFYARPMTAENAYAYWLERGNSATS